MKYSSHEKFFKQIKDGEYFIRFTSTLKPGNCENRAEILCQKILHDTYIIFHQVPLLVKVPEFTVQPHYWYNFTVDLNIVHISNAWDYPVIPFMLTKGYRNRIAVAEFTCNEYQI